MTAIGTKIIEDSRTARQFFDGAMANPARVKLSFGAKAAIVNVDFLHTHANVVAVITVTIG